MEIVCKQGTLSGERCEAVLVPVFESNAWRRGEMRSIDDRLNGAVGEMFASKEFSGKENESAVIHAAGRFPAKRVVLIGLGKPKGFDLDRVRRAYGAGSRRIRDLGVKRFSAALPQGATGKISRREIAEAAAEGALLGTYQFTAHKTETDEIKTLAKMTLIASDARSLSEIERGMARGRIIAEATNFARDLANHPSNTVTPTRLAEAAREIGKNGKVKVKVLDRAEMERLKMGALLGVSRGSEEPAKFIILEYFRGKKGSAPVALVGKSITFDTGGISLKPGENMEQMKYDMSGGAAVLGTIKAISAMGLPVNVVGILPATENMPSGTAIKPGDVLRSMSGKTIEVINTDAEGRLILADGLHYATQYKPAAIIDLATLTGACVVALGNHAIGMLGNRDSLKRKIEKAGRASGERVWELPLWEEYYEQIKSDVADVRNIGGRPAGMITAAAFLSKFVGDVPWAHLDIAGTAWSEKDRPIHPKGCTGVGVRLLCRFLMDGAGKRT